ncbi:MAG: trypsin-like peptidase domain-containing protein [Proteobacteria bacterium]|nr:trypsin-like peptidase domain-containing protein [Pseudomonadota bacterium]
MRRFLAVTVALALSATAAFADMDAAYDAFDREAWDAALAEFLPHARDGDARAQVHVGYLYANGLGTAEDAAEAAFWWEQAATQGDSDAQFFLAGLYFDGVGVLRDRAAAAYWYGQAAAQGDPEAQYYLALQYETGDGVAQSDATAAEWMRQSAEQGHADAQYGMGLNHDGGFGVAQDFALAAEWYRRAAEQGHAEAQLNLAYSYFAGEGVERDEERAAEWYRRAADQGLAKAQLAMGALYALSAGVPQDDFESARYYRMAAEQGEHEAQHQLGMAYLLGIGAPVDAKVAVTWFDRAAEQGNADSMFQLAVAYDEGVGAAIDDLEAAWWYMQAALYGIGEAANNLGVMYSSGEGVAQDDVLALFWYRMAIASGDSDTAPENLDNLRGFMSEADIARGEQLFADYLAGVYTPSLDAPDGAFVPPPPERGGGAAPEVARIQAALAQLGYDPGPADGVIGPRTRAAIAAFQADYGLEVTSEINDQLNLALVVAHAAESRRSRGGGFAAAAAELELVGTGTGFVVSASGQVITNHHVINGCAQVRLRTNSLQTFVATVQAAELESDLALLRAPDLPVVDVATFRSGRGIRPGEELIVIGYPLFGADMVTQAEAIVTTGTLSALAGPGDDRRLMQITAPVQPGNSGGPVVDAGGNIVGVVVAKLDALVVAEAIGDIPQNINFALQGWLAQVFLDSHVVEYRTAETAALGDIAAAAAAGRARGFTVLVECHR